jgi:uncharacterized protein (TIGR02453 family)
MDFPRLTRYLAELDAHNEKAWFEAHRAEYQALRDDFTAFVGGLLARLAEWDEGLRWVDPKDCLFRIYRDVRFSRDKSPYKTTFAASMGEGGRRDHAAGYYFHVDAQGTLAVAGGVYMPTPDQLARIRDHIAEHPEQVDEVLGVPGFRGTFGEIRGERLKRPPRGYGDQTPHLELIKQKGFYVVRERDARSGGDDVVEWMVDSFHAMQPLFAWLREALGTSAGHEAAPAGV